MMHKVWIFILLALLFGCVPKTQESTAPVAVADQGDYTDEDDIEWASEQDPSVNDMFRKIANTAVGTPYVRGGTTMGGFDCSGFVQWTYKNMGVDLPRTAREQSQVGQVVSYSNMRIGDIVTFRHPRRGWHSGIYMGNDQFVHSPSRRQRVRYSAMSDPYFRDTFVNARRVSVDKDLDFEDATRRLAVAENEKRFTPDEPERSVSKSKKAAGAKGGKTKKTAIAQGKADKKRDKPSKVMAVAAKTDQKSSSAKKADKGVPSKDAKTQATAKSSASAQAVAKNTASSAAAKPGKGKDTNASASAAPKSAKSKDSKAAASTAAKSGARKNPPRQG